MKSMKQDGTNIKGFTLIEIAIVLVILGLLIGLGAGLIGPLTKRAKLLETRETIAAAVESLISYGASNNKLPTTGNFTSTVKNPNDAWTKSLYYITDTNLTDNTIGGICGRKTTNLTLKICPDTGCSSPTSTISNVAIIVLSGGGNYNNQTAGTQAVSSSTTISAYEVDVSVDGYTSDMDRTEAYDDIYKWVTLDELRIKTGCSGPPLRIVNNELPYGYEDSTYSATVYADGGVAFDDGDDSDSKKDYEWCWEDDPTNGSPTDMTFTCDGSLASSSACSLTSGTWDQCTSVSLGGTPSTNGSFSITFFARDENDSSSTNDNIAEKTFVLTLNPASGTESSSSCTEIQVWYSSGDKKDFSVDSWCHEEVDSGNEITDSSHKLQSGQTITKYSDKENNCSDSVSATLSFSSAQSADSDGDCQVNFDGTDK